VRTGLKQFSESIPQPSIGCDIPFLVRTGLKRSLEATYGIPYTFLEKTGLKLVLCVHIEDFGIVGTPSWLGQD
jgi:hypothetical protein